MTNNSLGEYLMILQRVLGGVCLLFFSIPATSTICLQFSSGD